MDWDVKTIGAVSAGIATILGAIVKVILVVKKKPKVTGISKNKSQLVKLDSIQVQNALKELRRRVVQEFHVSKQAHNWEIKQAVFKDIMYNKVTIWMKQIARLQDQFTCRGDCSSCHSVAASLSFNLTAIRNGMGEYRDYWKINGKAYSPEEIQSIKIAMDKFTELHKANESRVMSTIEYGHKVDGIVNFCAQFTNYYIIKTYESALYSMLEDVEKAIEILNGDMDGLTFREREYEI